MYAFVLNMWILRKVTESKVRTYSSVFLKANEIESILATPQIEE